MHARDAAAGGSLRGQRALRRAPAAALRPLLRARALGCLGQALWRLGEVEEAQRLEEAALAIFHEQGDREGIAWTQINLGAVAYGRVVQAMVILQHAGAHTVGFITEPLPEKERRGS